MGLNSDWPHAVDILVTADAAPGPKMMRRGNPTAVVSTGNRCRVFETALDGPDVTGREVTRHTFRVHFKADPALNPAHTLRWTQATNQVVFMKVVGTRRPQGTRAPWVVFCTRTETAEAALATPPTVG